MAGFITEIIDDQKSNELEALPEKEVTVDFQSLMVRAIDTKVDVNTLERMLAMWEKLQAKKAEKMYFDALRAFQDECPIITKNKKVYDKNGCYRFSYAPIEDVVDQIKDLLKKHGFSYTVTPEQTEGKFTAVLKSHHAGGHCEITRFEVPIDAKMYASEPQKVAAARTLSVRYAILDAYGIVTADGDIDGDDMKEGKNPMNHENQEGKPPTKKTDPGSLPDKNFNIFSLIMSLIREKYKGKEIFPTKEEKETKVKAANALVMDLTKLTDFHKALNVEANRRRLEIDQKQNT